MLVAGDSAAVSGIDEPMPIWRCASNCVDSLKASSSLRFKLELLIRVKARISSSKQGLPDLRLPSVFRGRVVDVGKRGENGNKADNLENSTGESLWSDGRGRLKSNIEMVPKNEGTKERTSRILAENSGNAKFVVGG